jgi:hypothetical protein
MSNYDKFEQLLKKIDAFFEVITSESVMNWFAFIVLLWLVWNVWIR